MEAVFIRNHAGELNISWKSLDSENRYYDLHYSLSLNKDVDFSKITLRLLPYNEIGNAYWVDGFEEKLGIIKSETDTVFSGHQDIAINPSNLKGSLSEEVYSDNLIHYVKTMVDRFVFLGFVSTEE
jgi:hypothetical protein